MEKCCGGAVNAYECIATTLSQKDACECVVAYIYSSACYNCCLRLPFCTFDYGGKYLSFILNFILNPLNLL